MSTQTGPNQILLIRHGEKVGDPKKDDDGGRHLAIPGSARAAALPSLFAVALTQLSCKLYEHAQDFHGNYRPIPLKGKAGRFLPPNFIFATQESKNSNRPIETVTPLGTALSLPINNGYADNAADIKAMAAEVLKDFAFAGKIVLICWHHGTIPDVARALGIAKPPKWDGKVFDRVWQITFPKGKATMSDLPQQLLYGDSSK
jgi:hypothetical protein